MTTDPYSPSPAFEEAAAYLSNASSLTRVSNSVKLEVLPTHSLNQLRILTKVVVILDRIVITAIWPLQDAHRGYVAKHVPPVAL